MTQLNTSSASPTTTRHGVAVSGLSSVIAGIVASLLSPREVFLRRRAPSVPGVHQWRRDVKLGKLRFVQQLLKSGCADIDDGAPVHAVTQYLDDMKTFFEQYAERKARRESSGVLPFNERLVRAAVTETQAEGAANVATQIAECRPEDVQALRNARAKLQAEGEPKEHLVEVLTSRIVELEMRSQ